jgi:hypothetical protein
MNYLYCWHRPGKSIRGEIRQCRHCGVAIEECVCAVWRQAASGDCVACEGSGWVGILRSKAAGLAQTVGL